MLHLDRWSQLLCGACTDTHACEATIDFEGHSNKHMNSTHCPIADAEIKIYGVNILPWQLDYLRFQFHKINY